MTATDNREFSNNRIFYQLSIEDIQNVATEIYGRELSQEEIKKVLDPIADRIPWFDAIENALRAVLDIAPEEINKDEE